MKSMRLPDMLPLLTPPAPFGASRHNGGPPLEPRLPGRPTISTPALRERILELLGEGIPLRAMCRTEGMPSRGTVYGWRRADPEFNHQCHRWAQEGRIHLVETVSDEFERVLEEHGHVVARRVFNLRKRQLVRVNPRYFGGE
jgi:hypothetical protein